MTMKARLVRLLDKIEEHFPDCPVRIEATRDPEGKHRQVFLYVGVRVSAEKALDMLHRFDHDWWLDAYRQYGDMEVSVEYLARDTDVCAT
jgi:hypothetical protein